MSGIVLLGEEYHTNVNNGKTCIIIGGLLCAEVWYGINGTIMVLFAGK
jgi:hypothetical protein